MADDTGIEKSTDASRENAAAETKAPEPSTTKAPTIALRPEPHHVEVGLLLDLPSALGGSGWTVQGTDVSGNVVLTQPGGNTIKRPTILHYETYQSLRKLGLNKYRKPKKRLFPLHETKQLKGVNGDIIAEHYDAQKDAFLVSGRINGQAYQTWVSAKLLNALAHGERYKQNTSGSELALAQAVGIQSTVSERRTGDDKPIVNHPQQAAIETAQQEVEPEAQEEVEEIEDEAEEKVEKEIEEVTRTADQESATIEPTKTSATEQPVERPATPAEVQELEAATPNIAKGMVSRGPGVSVSFPSEHIVRQATDSPTAMLHLLRDQAADRQTQRQRTGADAIGSTPATAWTTPKPKFDLPTGTTNAAQPWPGQTNVQSFDQILRRPPLTATEIQNTWQELQGSLGQARQRLDGAKLEHSNLQIQAQQEQQAGNPWRSRMFQALANTAGHRVQQQQQTIVAIQARMTAFGQQLGQQPAPGKPEDQAQLAAIQTAISFQLPPASSLADQPTQQMRQQQRQKTRPAMTAPQATDRSSVDQTIGQRPADALATGIGPALPKPQPAIAKPTRNPAVQGGLRPLEASRFNGLMRAQAQDQRPSSLDALADTRQAALSHSGGGSQAVSPLQTGAARPASFGQPQEQSFGQKVADMRRSQALLSGTDSGLAGDGSYDQFSTSGDQNADQSVSSGTIGYEPGAVMGPDQQFAAMQELEQQRDEEQLRRAATEAAEQKHKARQAQNAIASFRNKQDKLKKAVRLIDAIDVAMSEDIVQGILAIISLNVQMINKVYPRHPLIPATDFPWEDMGIISFDLLVFFLAFLSVALPLVMFGALFGSVAPSGSGSSAPPASAPAAAPQAQPNPPITPGAAH